MNITLLRLYKYYLTYCGSLINRHHRCTPISKSIFITKFDGLGDFFLLLPLLRKLLDTGYSITMTGSPFQKEVLAHCNLDIHTIPFSINSIRELRSMVQTVKNLKPEFAVNLSMNAWGGILVNQSLAQHTVGLLQEREWYIYKGSKLFYDRTVSYEPDLHNFEVNRCLFNDLLAIGDFEANFDMPAMEQNDIVIHPYASWKPKRWPYFIELVEKLTHAGHKCVVIGTAAEHAAETTASVLAANPLCRIATLGSVSDLLAEVEHSSVFIGNDSGPAHYAGLIGKPTFVLWGPGPFERIHPLGPRVRIFKKEIECRPCRQRGPTCSRGDNECLKSINANEVVEAISATVRSSK